MKGVGLMVQRKGFYAELAPMWQRIQTLYMLLAAAALVFIGMQGLGNTESMIGGLAVALFLANITYFKHRKRQFMINRLAMFAVLGLIGSIAIPMLRSNSYDASLTPTLVASLLALGLGSFANRAIQKDEAKVKSDRRFRK